FIERYAARPTLAELLDAIGDEIARRLALGFVDLGLDGGGTEKVDAGFVDALLGVVAEGVEGVGVGASPWARVFTSAAEHERSGYFFSADDRLLFLLVEPRREAANFTDNERFIAAIRGAIRTLRATYPDVAAGATGTPALSNDEMLTEFRGIQEFGFVAGIAILMAFIAMLTLFPALLVTMHWRPVPAPAATGAGGAADVPLLGHLLRRRVSILIVAAALTSGALLALPAVRFDYSRLNLQARGTESVIWERKIMESRRSGFAAL